MKVQDFLNASSDTFRQYCQSLPSNVQEGLARNAQEVGEIFDEVNFGGSTSPEYLEHKAAYVQGEQVQFLLVMGQAGLEGYSELV
jgi:hypothetical protein